MFTAVRSKSPVQRTRGKRDSSGKHCDFQKPFGKKSKGGIRRRLVDSICWAWREFQYWLCYYDDEDEVDVEELLSNPFNTQPPSLDELSKITGFQKQWIIFLYRNFKQKCLNGRMSIVQWRQIFRLIFKNATDIEFADRIFLVIAGNRSKKLITFEDLIMYLYGLSQNGTGSDGKPSVITQFAFSLMNPNDRGQVDLKAFTDYVECVFSLNSKSSLCSEGIFDNLQITASTTTSSSKTSSSPALQTFAAEQFKAMDKEEKGYITVDDLGKLFDDLTYGSLILCCQHHLNGESLHN